MHRDDELVAEYDPSAHATQEVAPNTLANIPAGQLEHCALAESALYHPGEQLEQEDAPLAE